MTSVKDKANYFQNQINQQAAKANPDKVTKEPVKPNVPHAQKTVGFKRSPEIEQQSVDYSKSRQIWEEASRKNKESINLENAFQKLPKQNSDGKRGRIDDVQVPEQLPKSSRGANQTTSKEKHAVKDPSLVTRSSRSSDKTHSTNDQFPIGGNSTNLTHWSRQSSRFDEDISIEDKFLKSQMSNTFQLMYKVLEPMNLGTPIESVDGKGQELKKDVEARAKKLINRIFGPKPGEEEIIVRSLPVPVIMMISKLLKAPLPQPIMALGANDVVTVKRKPRGQRQSVAI